MPSLIHEEDIKLLLTIHTHLSYKMTNTTLPKLTFAQYRELEDAAEKLGTFDQLMNQNGLEGLASNAKAMHAALSASDHGFEDMADLYDKEILDCEFREELITLLTEINLIDEADHVTDAISKLQSIK